MGIYIAQFLTEGQSQKKKEEMRVLIELNKKLKARNHFLERENNVRTHPMKLYVTRRGIGIWYMKLVF